MLKTLCGKGTPREGQDRYLPSFQTGASYSTDNLPLGRNAVPEAGDVEEDGKLHDINTQRILEGGARGWSGPYALVRRLRLFGLGEGQDDGESAAQQGAIAEAFYDPAVRVPGARA